jgi:hypothetical protein
VQGPLFVGQPPPLQWRARKCKNGSMKMWIANWRGCTHDACHLDVHCKSAGELSSMLCCLAGSGGRRHCQSQESESI